MDMYIPIAHTHFSTAKYGVNVIDLALDFLMHLIAFCFYQQIYWSSVLDGRELRMLNQHLFQPVTLSNAFWGTTDNKFGWRVP